MIESFIQDLNFEKEIGANSLAIDIGPFRLVVDAGMDPKRTGREALPHFEFLPPNSVDAVVLTHCHLDHIGGLPSLLKHQTQAKILLSQPTSLLAPTMLENSYSVMCRQKMEQSILDYPLYKKKDIIEVQQHFQSVPLGQAIHLEKEGCELDITFYPAGHILGASSVCLAWENRRILVTGDILFKNQHSLHGARIPKPCEVDTIILETTRGRTERKASRTDEENRLLKTLAKTLKRGGTCLIPAFALGRLQELIVVLHQAQKEKKLQICPIFCSGLGMALVGVFDEVGKKSNDVHFSRKLLKQLNIKSLRRKKIGPETKLQAPAIYLLSSGMLVEHTPSYQVASSLIQSSKNTICFVGYCDPDTPGGRLLETAPNEVFTFASLDFSTPLRAQVEHFDLSGHADRDDLLQFIIDQAPKKVILTHGDEEARSWFQSAFADQCPQLNVLNPEVGKRYAF